VQTEALDNLLGEKGVERVDAIKIDVEGAEELVLRGAVKCLTTQSPIIIFEFNPAALPASAFYRMAQGISCKAWATNSWCSAIAQNPKHSITTDVLQYHRDSQTIGRKFLPFVSLTLWAIGSSKEQRAFRKHGSFLWAGQREYLTAGNRLIPSSSTAGPVARAASGFNSHIKLQLRSIPG